jgi:translation initiation factor IF-2
MDKEGSTADAVMTQLMSEDVLVEDFGGDTQCAQVSAKTGAGVEDLLNKILLQVRASKWSSASLAPAVLHLLSCCAVLQAEIMDLRARKDGAVAGSVLEVRRDKGLGMVVTAIIRSGTLRVGDLVLAGSGVGKVRRLLLDTGRPTLEAGPSTPVQVWRLCYGDGWMYAGDFCTM